MQKSNNDNQSKYFLFTKNFHKLFACKTKIIANILLRLIRWEKKTEIKNRENNRKMENVECSKTSHNNVSILHDNLFASIKTPQATDLYRTQLDLTNLLCFPFNSDYIVLCFYPSLPRSFGFFKAPFIVFFFIPSSIDSSCLTSCSFSLSL